MGSALRWESVVKRLKPVSPNGWIIEWHPPAIITSASPARINSVASPTAWLEAAHAVKQLLLGPWASNKAATCAAGMLGSCSISSRGSINSIPFWMNRDMLNSGPTTAASTIRVKLLKF